MHEDVAPRPGLLYSLSHDDAIRRATAIFERRSSDCHHQLTLGEEVKRMEKVQVGWRE